MLKLMVLVALWSFNGQNMAVAMKGLDLVFKSNPDTPRALLVGDNVLPTANMDTSQFTFCFYLYINRSDCLRTITPISYSSRETCVDNEICLDLDHKWNYTTLTINKEGSAFFGYIPKADKWTHICVVWMNDYGQVDYYFDGNWVESKFGLKIDHKIGGNGYFVLGQDQDGYDSGYEAKDGVTGFVTQFHYWDFPLTDEQVLAALRCELQGNIINWNNSTWRLTGNMVVQVSTAPCGGICEDKRGTEDVCTTPADVSTTPADVSTTPADVSTIPADVSTTPEGSGGD